jgi:hypothetical protein
VDIEKRLLDAAERYEKLTPRGRRFVDDELKRRDDDRVHNARYEWAGLATGAVIGIGALVSSTIMVMFGDVDAVAAGKAIGLTNILSLTTVFVIGTQKRRGALRWLGQILGRRGGDTAIDGGGSEIPAIEGGRGDEQ